LNWETSETVSKLVTDLPSVEANFLKTEKTFPGLYLLLCNVITALIYTKKFRMGSTRSDRFKRSFIWLEDLMKAQKGNSVPLLCLFSHVCSDVKTHCVSEEGICLPSQASILRTLLDITTDPYLGVSNIIEQFQTVCDRILFY
jgi:hypothetical protein